MKFLDSNILIYAADDTDPVKSEKACSIVERAISSEGFMVSAQVLNEFACVLLRKLKKPVDEIETFLAVLESIRTVPVQPAWTRKALEVMARYGLQFYDSLLIVAAAENGCTEFWSEDLNDAQTYCGMKVINPFR